MILKDKVVIITGAGPGMGQAMCHGAAAEGAKVVVTARSKAAIEEVAHEIVAAGGEAIAVPLDVTQMDQCQAAAKAALDTWGRIDGLVNSAYYHPDWGPLIEHDIDQVLQAFNVGAAGALRMAMAVFPAMKAQGAGSIVNISTLCTRKPMPGEGGYGMAKGALNHMTRHLAVEFGGTGVRVPQDRGNGPRKLPGRFQGRPGNRCAGRKHRTAEPRLCRCQGSARHCWHPTTTR